MDKLHIGIFGECPIVDKGKIADIIADYIDRWIQRQTYEVHPSHIKIVGISEPRGVVEVAKEFANTRGYSTFTVPLLEQRYKTTALWMRNANILENINHLLIIKRPKKSLEYLQRLETRAREQKLPVMTIFINADETPSSISY